MRNGSRRASSHKLASLLERSPLISRLNLLRHGAIIHNGNSHWLSIITTMAHWHPHPHSPFQGECYPLCYLADLA
jgi:hypothetical protein